MDQNRIMKLLTNSKNNTSVEQEYVTLFDGLKVNLTTVVEFFSIMPLLGSIIISFGNCLMLNSYSKSTGILLTIGKLLN